MNCYEKLRAYYQNGCVLHPGTPPVWGEVGYAEYVKEQVKTAGIEPGATISVDVKNGNGNTASYSGTVLHIYDDRFHMLTQGNKVWKDRSNREQFLFEDVTKIEKLKDKKSAFDIYKADPYNYPTSAEDSDKFQQYLEKDIGEKYQQRFLETHPNFDTRTGKILWLLFDFYWSYDDCTVKKAEITIVKKNRDTVSLPAYKIKHIYPNHSYFTVCGATKKATDCGDHGKDGLLLTFDSMEELSQIRMISCLWTVETDDEELRFLNVWYPKFIPGSDCVYNIACKCTDMRTYEESLHSYSFFSGRLEKEFDKAFVLFSNPEGESVYDVMNAEDFEKYVLDVLLSLNSNDLQNVIGSFEDQREHSVEVFIKNAAIKPKGYVWPY